MAQMEGAGGGCDDAAARLSRREESQCGDMATATTLVVAGLRGLLGRRPKRDSTPQHMHCLPALALLALTGRSRWSLTW